MMIGLLFIKKEQLQPRILSNLLCFCRTGIVARRYHNNLDTSLISSMHILKEVCYMMTSFPVIHFFYDETLFHGSTWSDPCQGHCVYFTTLVAAIHYNKRSVVDSRKFEGYVYLRKTIVALWICNHWISWYFKKKFKKRFRGNALADCKICTARRIYLSKNHLQSWRQLAFQ